MKFLKTIFSILILLSTIINTYAQYQNVTIYTPNNTSVIAGNFVGTDYTSSQKNQLKDYWLSYYDNRIEYDAEATYKYNCHAYAWHVSEGGSQVWINTPEDDKYWNDGSYVEISPSIATKVSFGQGDDHSAITTSTQNYFISKWGSSPRFRHHKDDCPYSTNDLHYYVRLTISGPSTICATPAVYTLSPGSATSWSVTPASVFSITASDATSATVTASNYAGQSGTLTAVVGGASVTKAIQTCTSSISGTATICATPATYTLSPGTATTWTVQPASAFSITSQNATSAVVKALDYMGSSGTLTATVNGIVVTKPVQTCLSNVSISGPSIACKGSTVTFTVTGILSSGYTWNSRSNITLLSTSGNTASFYLGRTLSYESLSGLGSSINDTWVGIQIGGIQVARRNITMEETSAGSITGPYDLSCYCLVGIVNPGTYQFMATNMPSSVTGSNVVWELAASNSFILTTNYSGISPLIHFSETGSYTLKMKYNGTCGYSPYVTKPILVTEDWDIGDIGGDGPGLLYAYPNPASSTLYVEIEEELQTMLQSQQSSALSSASSSASAVVYRVQLVAAQTGAVAYNQILSSNSSNSSNLSINLSNIPDGLYSLIVTKNNTLLHSETVLIQH
jgi:hypothetical protein